MILNSRRSLAFMIKFEEISIDYERDNDTTLRAKATGNSEHVQCYRANIRYIESSFEFWVGYSLEEKGNFIIELPFAFLK